MRNIIFFLVLLACSTAPKAPTISTGHSVLKRTYYQVEGAGDALRRTDQATIAAWIRPHGEPQWNEDILNFSVGGKNEPWKSRAGFRVIKGGAFQSIARASDHEESSEINTIPGLEKLNQWQHVALTIDYAQKSMQFFVNGLPVETAHAHYRFQQKETSDTPSNRVSIGAEDDGSAAYFNGDIAGAFVEKKVLSPEEIGKVMKNTRP